MAKRLTPAGGYVPLMGSRTSWDNHRCPLASAVPCEADVQDSWFLDSAQLFSFAFREAVPRTLLCSLEDHTSASSPPSRPQTMLVSWDIGTSLEEHLQKDWNMQRAAAACSSSLCVARCGCDLWSHMDSRQSSGQSMGIGYRDQNWA